MLLPGQDPTVAQLKANMSRSGGRGDTMLSELVRLGSTLLPPLVEDLRRDPQYQLDLPDIHEWELEGCQVEKAFPFVTFGLSSEVTWTGVHGNSESWTVPVKIWHPLPATIDEKLNALALAQVLWQVYANKAGASCDPAGRMVWNQLHKGGITFGDGKEYPAKDCIVLTVIAEQFRGSNYWQMHLPGQPPPVFPPVATPTPTP